ncbi:MAG: hypothetical protein ABIV63_08515 [Caldimonas sp.]
MFTHITAAALAGFMLPYSWLLSVLSRWLPSLEFDWQDYLRMWEGEDRGAAYWSCFGAGVALSVAADASMVVHWVLA